MAAKGKGGHKTRVPLPESRVYSGSCLEDLDCGIYVELLACRRAQEEFSSRAAVNVSGVSGVPVDNEQYSTAGSRRQLQAGTPPLPLQT